MILTACGTYDNSSNKNSQSDTDNPSGSAYTAVSFSLTIDDNDNISSPLAGDVDSTRTLAKLDCSASSIATIEVAVYDSAGTELVHNRAFSMSLCI